MTKRKATYRTTQAFERQPKTPATQEFCNVRICSDGPGYEGYAVAVAAERATAFRSIRTDADHQQAMKEITRLMDLKPELGTPESDRLEVLAILAEAYERKKYPALAGQEPIAKELLEALRYARRFLRPEDHDTAYVDDIIARASATD